jgi:hypothetical protein
MEAAREKTLQAYFTSSATADQHLRPIMTSLNGDNSWLLSFPRPDAEREKTGKAYYHLVFEPWLNGPTNLLNSWVLQLRNSKEPAIVDGDGVAAVARQIESAAAGAKTVGTSGDSLPTPQSESQPHYIDAIFLGFHYLDHIHKPTLLTFDPSIPVIASREAQATIKPWDHFSQILTIPSLDGQAKSWRDPDTHPGHPFPSWLTTFKLLGHQELNFVTVIIWTHEMDGVEVHEAILQSPHGIRLNGGPLQAFLDSEPKTEKLALLHGLKESRIWSYMNTYGVKGGLALWRKIGGAKYWVPSHHAVLHYSGVLSKMFGINDAFPTMQCALDEEAKKGGKGDAPNMCEVENGACLVLI